MAKPVLGPHGHDFTALATCLQSFGDEEIIFVPNPGNAGDALIGLGTFQFFDRIGLRYRLGEVGDTFPGKVVIYAGGGALIDAYPGSDRFFRRNHPVCKALVLLPHTVRAYPDLLAAMDERCILFAREAESHAYLTRHCTRAQVRLCHDMAFFLSPASIRAERWSLAHLRKHGLLAPWLRMVIKFGLLAKIRSATLSIVRTDVEKTALAVPSRNYDLSVFFNSDDKTRPGCANTAKVLSHVFSAYRQIETNRLHMAILGALLGKTVRMFDNSYGKNRAIYDQSIRDFFSKVTFIPERPADS